jgi:hypothetical protein
MICNWIDRIWLAHMNWRNIVGSWGGVIEKNITWNAWYVIELTDLYWLVKLNRRIYVGSYELNWRIYIGSKNWIDGIMYWNDGWYIIELSESSRLVWIELTILCHEMSGRNWIYGFMLAHMKLNCRIYVGPWNWIDRLNLLIHVGSHEIELSDLCWPMKLNWLIHVGSYEIELMDLCWLIELTILCLEMTADM